MRKAPPKKQVGQGLGPRTINGAAMDLRNAAAFWGGSEKQTRALVERQLIPFRRFGGRIIFIRSEIESWLMNLDGCDLMEAKANQEARR